MNLERLNEILSNSEKYRSRQAYEAIFQRLVSNWGEATNLPKGLIAALEEFCPLEIKAEIFEDKKSDSSKSIISLSDGLKIETVLMNHKDGRHTVCVSSMVGCPLGCSFCATGKMGFKRNLNKYEIAEQVVLFARILKKQAKKITNVVFMGMGEPFLNYDNVLGAVKLINDKQGFNLGARNISISTAGITEGIRKLAKEKLQVNLAISLHAPNDNLRKKLMPQAGGKYSIREILEAVDNYIDITNRRVMFEYILIKDLNDSDNQAEELAGIMEKPLYFVNLILYNPTGGLKPSERERVNSFKKILQKRRITVTQRHRFGEDINAACGQLAGRV